MAALCAGETSKPQKKFSHFLYLAYHTSSRSTLTACLGEEKRWLLSILVSFAVSETNLLP
jgi:hypothetical protein